MTVSACLLSAAAEQLWWHKKAAGTYTHMDTLCGLLLVASWLRQGACVKFSFGHALTAVASADAAILNRGADVRNEWIDYVRDALPGSADRRGLTRGMCCLSSYELVALSRAVAVFLAGLGSKRLNQPIRCWLVRSSFFLIATASFFLEFFCTIVTPLRPGWPHLATDR